MSQNEVFSYKHLFNERNSMSSTGDITENLEEKFPLTDHVATGKPSQSDWNYGSLHTRNTERQIRTVTKTGLSNFSVSNIEKNNWPFFADMFTTLLEIQWRWLIFNFCFAYFSSWLVFAIVWYLILYFNGDLNLNMSPAHIPCITNIDSFTTAFLFSVETMQTTGYGFYHITDKCPSAVITLCVQSIFGIILEGLMVGLVFVKLGRAKKRSATLMFSRNAVISRRDGHLCFMFRVADMRNKSHLLSSKIRAQYVGRRTTLEGEEISMSQQEIEVHGDGEKRGRLLLFWPTTVIHIINEDSPLFNLKPEDLVENNNNFEILVVLEGIVEGTGLMTQARSSYMPSEILYNHRFKNVTSTKSSKSGVKVLDYSNFHETYPVA